MENKVRDDLPIRVLFASRKSRYIIYNEIMDKIHELQRERDELIADRVFSDMGEYSEFQNLTTIQDKWQAVDKWTRDFTKPLSCESWYRVFERRDEEENAPVETDD